MAHRVKHVVLLQEDVGDGFVGETWRRWTFDVPDPPTEPAVCSVIRKRGERVSVERYGTDDPDIRRRVDDLVRRVKTGWKFASGPSGRAKRRHPKSEKIETFAFDLRFALTGSPPPKFEPGARTWEQKHPIRPEPSIWHRLMQAHEPQAEDDREALLDGIGDDLASNFPALALRRRYLRPYVRELLGKRAGVGGDADRLAFDSPEALVVAVTSMKFRCSEKTVRRAWKGVGNIFSARRTPLRSHRPTRS